MATVVLQVPDESLVSKVKNACKMLVGVTSVKVLSKREKSDACIESSEREATRRNVKVQKSTPKVDDITKTAHYKEAMDDVKNGRVYHANSVDDTNSWLMYSIDYTHQFKKDLRKCAKRGLARRS